MSISRAKSRFTCPAGENGPWLLCAATSSFKEEEGHRGSSSNMLVQDTWHSCTVFKEEVDCTIKFSPLKDK